MSARLLEFRSVIAALPESLAFGPWRIGATEVFYASENSYCFVNLKPVLPGHVLVAPRRLVARMGDLSDSELSDLWATARFASTIVSAAHPETDALTFTVQDGKSAGQTVPHVHVHVMPRSANDRFNQDRIKGNDGIYEAIDNSGMGVPDDKRIDSGSQARTREAMSEEAMQLRSVAEKLFT